MTTLITTGLRRLPAAPMPGHRAPRRPQPVPRWWRDASAAACWLLLLAVVALWVSGGGLAALGTLAGALTSLGRLTGLLSSALLLVQVLLMARVPWFERAWGQDQLVRTHRVVGFTSFTLLLTHLVLITLGYAADSSAGLWGTIVDLVATYPGMLLALAGTVALVMVVVTSLRRARRRLRYESWHLIHLYGYLGAFLALPHQLWTGADFLSSPVATALWWGLYAVAAGSVVVFRLALPLWRSLRSPLRVVHVRRDAADVTTVTVGGPGVARLAAHGGQFFNWRFLDGRGWTRANPYSLSAAPNGRTLRITAAHVGAGSARLAGLRVGTRVLVEGPYGRLHAGSRTRDKVLLLGSGIGITPMRAILEDLPAGVDAVVVHRVRDRGSAVLRDEIAGLARDRGARLVIVDGPRVSGRASWLPRQAAHLTDEQALLDVAPDLVDRDVFVCGSPGWMDAVVAACRTAGLASAQLHAERFTH